MGVLGVFGVATARNGRGMVVAEVTTPPKAVRRTRTRKYNRRLLAH